MADLKPDALFPKILPRFSESFRTVCRMTLQELRSGDPVKAYAFIDKLIATRPMNSVDRRCMFALRVAVRSIVGLRAVGLPSEVDFTQFIGTSVNLASARQRAHRLLSVLREEVAARSSAIQPCPNCGSTGVEIGWTRLMDRTGLPQGRFYLDTRNVASAAIPGEDLDPVDAELMVMFALAELDARAPVLACQGCGIRYVSWRHDPEGVQAAYTETLAGGFDIAGRKATGRAHVFVFSYGKAALPLYLDRLLGGIAGQAVYDFGCGEGIMAAFLADLGAHATGSDIDAPKIRYGQHALGLSHLSDQAEYFWSMPAQSLDGIVAFHSVEHLLSVDPFFSRFTELLKPGGWLAVSVPRVTVRPDGEVTEMGGSHLIGFNEDVLEGFFTRHGFEIVDRQVDDGSVPQERRDAILGLPDWAGRAGDVTIVGRRTG